MSKKTLALISVLLVLAAVLIAVAVMQKRATPQPLNTQNTTQPLATSPTVVKVPATTTVGFSSSSQPATNKPQELPITISSENDVTAVQLELTFDPIKLTNVTIAQPATGGFFDKPLELLKNVDTKKGRITYAFGITPTQQPKKGSGVAAVLSFTPNLNKGEQTTITFLPKTLVTAFGFNESVLKSTSNVTIAGQ